MNDVRRALAVATEHVRLGMANVTAAVLGSLYLILTARGLGPAHFSDVADDGAAPIRVRLIPSNGEARTDAAMQQTRSLFAGVYDY